MGGEEAWIPLTTHSRAELERQSPWERFLSLLRLLEERHPEALAPLVSIENARGGGGAPDGPDGATTGRTPSSMNDIRSAQRDADDALVRALRGDGICRRLASLAMRPYVASEFAEACAPDDRGKNAKYRHYPTCTTTLLTQFPHNRLLQRMSRLWKRFLELPSLEESKSYYRLPAHGTSPVALARNEIHANDANYPYQISIILPAYNERGSHVMSNLARALEMACHPNEIEVVVVDAGGCSDLEMLLSLAGTVKGKTDRFFGQVAIFSFLSGGGRGPCLNFGAEVSSGRILSFCHSDTTLPLHWDGKIVSTLEHDGTGNAELSISGKPRANVCAFNFGIDTSPEGLSTSFDGAAGAYRPPGILAVQIGVNLRCRLFSLPYGDQVLSLHARVFDHLGGFPDQCMMEDYELVSLLRQHAALFAFSRRPAGGMRAEHLAVVPGAPAMCSPRRWQKFGVLYVTFMNYKFVSLYAGTRKMSPDNLFETYYGKMPPKRASNVSPWEEELLRILG